MRWLTPFVCLTIAGCSSSAFDIVTGPDGAVEATADSDDDTGVPDTDLEEDTSEPRDSSVFPEDTRIDTSTGPDTSVFDSGLKDTGTKPDTFIVDTGTKDTSVPPPDTFMPPPDTFMPPPDTFMPPPDTSVGDEIGPIDKCMAVICGEEQVCCPSTGLCYSEFCLSCCMTTTF